MVQKAPNGLSHKDLYLFNEGSSYHSYRFMGAHLIQMDGIDGVRFTVWAPNAAKVRVIGGFNNWDGKHHPMKRIGTTGIFTLFVANIVEGEMYKYEIVTPEGNIIRKADPYAFYAERRPGTASIVSSLSGYEWGDGDWQLKKRELPAFTNPLLIYEVHAGSWKIKGKEDFYTYEELADDLIPYTAEMGYTHIELMPIAEHPLDQSWGYQITGFYGVTSRYGTPKQLMRFVDKCHQYGIGVILDWVPGHFCKDDHGLRLFDGTPIYEGADSESGREAAMGNAFLRFRQKRGC